MLLVGFVSTSIVGYIYTVKSLDKQIEKYELPLASNAIYSEFGRLLQKPVTISEVMSKNTFVQDWVSSGEKNRKVIENYLSSILKNKDVFTSFLISDKTRQYYHPNGKLRSINRSVLDDEWYFQSKAAKGDYKILNWVDKMNNDRHVVFVNYKLYSKKKEFLGLIGVGVSIENIRNLMERLKHDYGFSIYFVNNKGDIVLSNKGYGGPMNIYKDSMLSPYAKKILYSEDSVFQVEHGNNNVFIRSHFIPNTNWRLVIKKTNDQTELLNNPTLFGNILIAFLVTATVLVFVNITINRYQKRLEDMATLDPLTNTLNRRAFEMVFSTLSNLVHRKNEPLIGLLIDADHFKLINDQYGHLAGDKMLVAISKTIKNTIRRSDILCRWGGEEFFVLLPNCNLHEGKEIAEAIRKAIVALSVDAHNKTLSVTVSIGITQYIEEEHLNTFVSRIDELLYLAKNNGRNRIE